VTTATKRSASIMTPSQHCIERSRGWQTHHGCATPRVPPPRGPPPRGPRRVPRP
jgi:hypothetical protein